MADQTPAAGATPAPEAVPKKRAPSSQKRLGQSIRRQAANTPVTTATKHAVARAVRLIEAGDLGAAEAAVKSAVSALDRAAAKGVVQRNNAARRKSRLLHRLNKAKTGLAQKSPPAPAVSLSP